MSNNTRSITREIDMFLDQEDVVMEKLGDRLSEWRNMVQLRKQGKFQFAKSHGKTVDEMCRKDDERWLERTLFDQYCPLNEERRSKQFLLSSCEFLVGYQVPLKSELEQSGRWGSEIDLLGCDVAGKPVVIELKTGDSTDRPAKMLLEGVVYALAIQRAWQETPLRTEFTDAITKLNRSLKPYTDPLTSLTVICLPGKEEYWCKHESKMTMFHHIKKILEEQDIMGDRTEFKIVCAAVGVNFEIEEQNY